MTLSRIRKAVWAAVLAAVPAAWAVVDDDVAAGGVSVDDIAQAIGAAVTAAIVAGAAVYRVRNTDPAGRAMPHGSDPLP